MDRPQYSMNDLVAVGKDQFYITKFWSLREKLYQQMESLLPFRLGKIFFYNGFRARQVVTDLRFPNGINISPDMKTVYVAEFGMKKLRAFRRDPSNNLAQSWEENLETGVDNIDVDPATGDLVIGSHPITYKIIDMYNFFHFTPPSKVLRVKIHDSMVGDIEEIFADDGYLIPASSVAISTNGTLVVGSVSAITVACRELATS